MVSSFAAAAEQRGQDWTYLVRIEGLGDYDGQHTWTINVPDYAASDARFTSRDTIAVLPRITGGRTKSMLGGMPSAGTAAVELVDYSDLITSARRTDAAAVAMLSSAMGASDTSIVVTDGAALPASQFVVWIGGEAVRISSRASNTLTVASSGRAYLGTTARSQPAGSMVYLTCPYLRTRRMTIYLAPMDADSDAVATEYAIGTYRIDRCRLGQALGSWVLSGPSEERELGRLIAGRVSAAFKVRQLYGAPNAWLLTPVPGSRSPVDPASLRTLLETWPDGAAFYRIDSTKEVLRCDSSTGSATEPAIIERGALGSELGEVKVGDVVRPVLTSDETYGAFRWSPGPTPATSRGSGTWTVSQHPVDILLCLLTSAASRDDGLELANYTAAYGNWSSLPVGYGIGFPAGRIDFASFLSVRARYRVALDAVVIGDADPETFAEWATANILEPFGWFLTMTGGLLTLVAPRVLRRGETPDWTLDGDSIVELGEPEESYDLVAGAVTYRYRGPHGEAHRTTVRVSDLVGQFGGRAQYVAEDEVAVVDLPSVTSGGVGVNALLTLLAQRRLMRAVRAPWRLPVTVDSAFADARGGETVAITHSDMPDLATGVRGWTSVLGQITAVTPLALDDRGRLVRTLTVLVYPSFRSARIGPSAIITAVTGAGPYTCSIESNRYTAVGGDDYTDLPAEDGLAFALDDVVKTIDRAGVDVTTGHTISGVAGDELELTGGSAAPTAGDVIVSSDYGDATSSQHDRLAWWSDVFGEVDTEVPGDRYGEN